MERVPIEHVAPGMYLVRPLLDRYGRVLLKPGSRLTRRYIERIRKLGYPAVWCGEPWEAEILIDEVISAETRQRALKAARRLFEGGLVLDSEAFQEMGNSVEKLVDEVLANDSVLMNLTDIRSYDSYTFSHCVNTCVLSVLIGREMNLARSDLYVLGMGAILHDVGKRIVPADILLKPGTLNQEEFRTVQAHTTIGYEILSGYYNLDYRAATIALQHHERLDGSGYPRRLEGHAIHRFARIVGVADTYDAMTSDRVYKKALSVPEANRVMKDMSGLYDGEMIAALMRRVACYPVGTYVELDSGEIAVVLENNPSRPDYPRVAVIRNPIGERLHPFEEVDLTRDIRRIVGKAEYAVEKEAG